MERESDAAHLHADRRRSDGLPGRGAHTIGVVDLEEGGHLLAWMGETIPEDELRIGMELQVVPRIFEELEDIKVCYSLEKPGTPWWKTDSA